MATEPQINQVRRSVGDALKTNVEQFNGDNLTVLYNLKYHNIAIESITVDGEALDVGDYQTYSESGKVMLTDAPTENQVIIIAYGYSAFTDVDLAATIDAEGVDGTIVECLKELLASSARRSDYTQGQTKVSASQVFDHLKDLLAMYTTGGSLNSSNGGLSIGVRHSASSVQQSRPRDLSRDDERWDNTVA